MASNDEVPFWTGNRNQTGSLSDRRSKLPIALSCIFASVFAVAGALVLFLIPFLIHEGIKESFKMETPRASPYKFFADCSHDDVALKYGYYFYHVKNPYDVMHGARPQLEERGPYVWREYKTRPESVTKWLPDATVEYEFNYRYEFLREDSVGDTSDVVTIPSVPFLGYINNPKFRAIATDEQIFKALKIVEATSTRTFFDNLTIHEIFYNMPSRFANALKWVDLDWDLALLLDLAPSIAVGVSVNVTDEKRDSRRLDRVYTGGKASDTQPPAKSYMTMHSWHGNHTLALWGDKYGNMINGTDGTVQAPFLKKGEPLYVFVDDLFRSVLLAQTQTVQYQGVDLLRYEIALEQLLNETENPNNAAFNMKYRGMLETPENEHLPYFFSQVHYLDADTSMVKCDLDYLDTTKNSDLHTRLDYEPLTGSFMRGSKKLQMNIHLGEMFALNGSVWPNTKGLPDTILPVLWLDEHMDLPTKLVDDFKRDVQTPLLVSKYLGPVLLAIGALLFFLTVGLLVRYWRKGPQMYSRVPATGAGTADGINNSLSNRVAAYYGNDDA